MIKIEKSNLVFIIAIIVLIIIGLSLVYVLKNNKSKPIPITNNKQTNEIKPIISGWKVYESKEYGFRIDYPSEWEIKENTKNPIKIMSIVSPETLKYTKENMERLKNFYSSNLDEYFVYNSDISIFRYSSLEDRYGVKTIKDLTKVDDGTITKIGETQVDGIEATEFMHKGEGEEYVVISKNGEYFYEIVLNKVSNKENISDTIKKIISSFQFVK